MNSIFNKNSNFFLRSIFLIACMLFLYPTVSLKAQAPQFSQFYAAPLYLAPSFTGATDGSRVALNYRNQWPDLPGVFETYSVSLDHYFHDYNSGVGVLLFRDQAGSANLATTNAGILYSYNFNINRDWILRPGLHFLYSQRTIDYNKLVFGDQLSLDEEGITSTTQSNLTLDKREYFDASTSLVAYKQDTWVGFTFDHLMMPNQSMTNQESHIPLKFSLYGGYRFKLGRPLAGITEESISFTFLYKNQGPFNQFDLGAYWTKNPVSIGLLYRGIPIFNNPIHGTFNNDAMILMAALRTDNLRFGYSYDFTISNLLGSTGGAHEVSIIYEFNQGAPSKRYEPFPCPFSPYE